MATLSSCNRDTITVPSEDVQTKGDDPGNLAAVLVDVTEQSQLHFTYHNGEEANRYTILESLGGGVAMLDYNGDGRLDVYVTGGGTLDDNAQLEPRGLPGRLFENQGNWRFSDVTNSVGLSSATFYSNGCLAGDFDNDGWSDLLVTGFGGMTLYHNRPRGEQGRHFVDVTQEYGLTDSRWCSSAAWGDLMGNGRLDLYVCRYLDWSVANDPFCKRANHPQEREVCPPQHFQPLPHSLYQNEGSKFTDISDRMGLTPSKGLGVVLADINADGRPDLYVANDADYNFLFLNQGDAKLTESGLVAGVAMDDHGRYNGSMGVDVGDVDGDGKCSLLVTNYQGELPALYINLGQDSFLHQSQVAGLGAMGQEFVGFGTSLLDIENDGWLDLAIVNGHVLRYPVGAPFLQRPLLFHNVSHRGRRFFRDMSPRGGAFFSTPSLGRGMACGDLDNDGWPDLVVSQSNRPVTVLRNIAGETEPAHWFGLELVGKNNRPIMGATVRIDIGERQLTRFSKSGGSYLSSSDPRILFGLGKVTQVLKLSVHWPWGEVQHWDTSELAIDQYWRADEGAAKLQQAMAPK